MLNEITAPPIVSSNRAVELLNEVEGRIRGYVFIWGDSENRDSFQTYFSKSRPPETSLDFAPWPLHYEHAQDGAIRKEIVGKIDRVYFDDNGCRFEASLYRDSPFFGRIVSELKQRKLKTSSATSPHLADFDDEGRFVHWELSEVSLTANPSESRMPAVEIIRSLGNTRDTSAEQERNVPGARDNPLITHTSIENTSNREAIMPELISTPAPPAPEAQRDATESLKALQEQGYSLEEIAAALQALMSPEVPRAEGDMEEEENEEARSAVTVRGLLDALKTQRAAAQGDELAKAQAEIERLKKAARNAAPAPQPRPAHNPAPVSVQVNEPEAYRRLSDSDMRFVAQTLRSRYHPISEDFRRAMQMRAANAMEKNHPLFNDHAVRSAMPFTRANEVMTSTATGFGDEWVAVAYSTELWEKARNQRIYQELVNKGMRVEEIPQGHESITIFTESSDPTVYTISQNADVDATSRPTVVVGASPAATGNTLLTPGALGLRVVYNAWFDEDSLIAAAPQLNRQIQEKAEETIEQLMLNGDTVTTGTTNINLIDGTPGTGLAKPYYLASDGMIKYALLTGSGTSRNGGALDEDDFRATLKLMPSAIRTRKQQLAFVIDPDVHNTALSLAALKTQDVRGSVATLDSGVLSNIWGVDVFESGFILGSDSAGKVEATPGALGRLLCVFAPYWAMGWKRHITIETARDIDAQANIIVATMRLGFKYRGAGASTISYNLTIA